MFSQGIERGEDLYCADSEGSSWQKLFTDVSCCVTLLACHTNL